MRFNYYNVSQNLKLFIMANIKTEFEEKLSLKDVLEYLRDNTSFLGKLIERRPLLKKRMEENKITSILFSYESETKFDKVNEIESTVVGTFTSYVVLNPQKVFVPKEEVVMN